LLFLILVTDSNFVINIHHVLRRDAAAFQLEIAAKNADNMAETGRVSQIKRGKTRGTPDQIGIPTNAQEGQLTQAARFSQKKRDNKSK
jgi:hypothetical protein